MFEKAAAQPSRALRWFATIALLTLVSLIPRFLPAENLAESSDRDPVVAGELIVEPSTLSAVSFRWYIEGDEGRNAAVRVTYREEGSVEWREALPLMRIQHERVPGNPWNWTSPNLFAGSIFHLEPDTEYEVVLHLASPDGVVGEAERRVTVRTRPVPQPYQGEDANTYHVYPPGYTGERQQPAFNGLLAAYYQGAGSTDHYRAYPPRVQPGDTIVVHAGTYSSVRNQYGVGLGTPFFGTYFLTAEGTEEKPITIKAAGDGPVIFDGNDAHTLFNVMAADHHIFEGITIRNTDVAFQAGHKDIAGAVGLTVTHSTFENVGIGIHTDYSGSRNFYIADNYFTGRHDPNRLMGWTPGWSDQEGFPALIEDWFAVKVYGSGHVIEHNSIRNFHDGIATATYGRLDEDESGEPILDRMPVAIDILYNDISNTGDNCIEADGSMHNVRVIGNRCFNSAHRALSGQPILGGPLYLIRNVVYNAPEGPLKLVGDPTGILVYNNTLIGPITTHGEPSNLHLRNNLLIGQESLWQNQFPTYIGNEFFLFATRTNYSSSDYNAFRPDEKYAEPFVWSSPPFDVAAEYGTPLVVRRFATLEEYSDAVGQDAHSVLVDYDDFVRVTMPDPEDITQVYDPDAFDFALVPGSAAIGAGAYLPNVTDCYAGEAPDIGAIQSGLPPPVYGPRDPDAPVAPRASC